MQTENFASTAVGLSLREPNYSDFFTDDPRIECVEVITENYLYTEGILREDLFSLSERYSVHLHGVALNVCGLDPFDKESLIRLKKLTEDLKPAFVSDHLCWTRHAGKSSFDLLPFPFTRKMIRHAMDRIHFLQDYLGRNLLLENISTYFRFHLDEMDEVDFLLELQEKSKVHYLLDLNNLYVNEFNHGINPFHLISQLPPKAVSLYHLAGYSDQETFYFDAHDANVTEPVWDLYAQSLEAIGPRTTIIERDENIPGTATLLKEAMRAKGMLARYVQEKLDA